MSEFKDWIHLFFSNNKPLNFHVAFVHDTQSCWMECRGGLVYLGDLLYRIKSGFRLSKCDLGLCFHVHCVVPCVVLWCEAAADERWPGFLHAFPSAFPSRGRIYFSTCPHPHTRTGLGQLWPLEYGRGDIITVLGFKKFGFFCLGIL